MPCRPFMDSPLPVTMAPSYSSPSILRIDKYVTYVYRADLEILTPPNHHLLCWDGAVIELITNRVNCQFLDVDVTAMYHAWYQY